MDEEIEPNESGGLWVKEGPALSDEMVAKFESALEVKVPEDVLWFLKNVVNGGVRRADATFYIKSDNEDDPYADIEFIFGIGHPDEFLNLEAAIRELPPILHYMWPIALDADLGRYGVIMDGPGKGEIRHIEHFEYDEPECWTQNCVTSDIREFSKRVVGDPVPDDELEAWLERDFTLEELEAMQASLDSS